MVKYFYPTDKPDKLATRTISDAKIKKYASKKYSITTKRIGSTLTLSEVVSEINGNRPIFIGSEGSGVYKNGLHALVIRGYNIKGQLYSVWNPWDMKSYGVITASAKTLKVSGGSFTWKDTIYGWKK